MFLPWAASLLSALLLWAAFPPVDIAVFALVAPVPFLWAVRRVERPMQATLLGFVFGAAFYGALLYWLIQLGMVAWIPYTVLMGSITAAYGFLVWTFRLWSPWRWWLIAVGGWVVIEWLRGRFPFGGFPWGDLGYAATRIPGALGSVQWVGPYGWSMLAIAFAAGLVLLIESRENWRFAVDAGVVILLFAIAGGLFPPRADGAIVQVAIVQGGTPCPRVHCQNENQRIYQRHMALTETIRPLSVDLVVWPENSTGPPYEPEGNEQVRAEIVDQATRIGAYFLVSGTRPGPEPGTFLNVNAFFSPDGVKVGEYQKRHPVPFGEFVPMRGLLDFVPQLDQVPNDMVRGAEAVVFPLDDGVLGSVISFEGAFSRHMRWIAAAGSTMMAVATNESTFGYTSASSQLIGLVRVNAAAIGQDTILAAITGKSTFIEANGDVRATTDLFTEGVHYGWVQIRTAGPTPYTRFGDWVMLLALAALVVAFAVRGEATLESGTRRWSGR